METGGVSGRASGRPTGAGRHRESRVARVVDRHSPGFWLEWFGGCWRNSQGGKLRGNRGRGDAGSLLGRRRRGAVSGEAAHAPQGTPLVRRDERRWNSQRRGDRSMSMENEGSTNF